MKSLKRRDFIKVSAGVGLGVFLPRCKTAQTDGTSGISQDQETYDYIVVGSGAGGGPLAANLAREGFRVLLLEAGGPAKGNLNVEVPAFNTLSTEDPELSWHFYVNHYKDAAKQKRNSKLTPQGVLYPRAATWGGCTSHNAMIMVYPHNSDWNGIAQLTGDTSWQAEKMREYFKRVEQCTYVSEFDDRRRSSRHGYKGWLPTSQIDTSLALRNPFDLKPVRIITSALSKAGLGSSLSQIISGTLDPNDWNTVSSGISGVFNTPVTISKGRRAGVREYLIDTQTKFPRNLVIRSHALVSRVLFREKKAAGVEYLSGAKLYRADMNPATTEASQKVQVFCRREVILAGGAFNTPQLLMLSGVGPADELQRHNIAVVHPLPGVGRNLQDRYEVTVVNKLKSSFDLLKNCAITKPRDPCLDEWKNYKTGPYTANGVILGMARKSSASAPDTDLYIFGAPGFFKGYYPGYAKESVAHKDMFTWAVLKAHTGNRGGEVTLKSADPRDTPVINFNYFEDGDAAAVDSDLNSVLSGLKFARSIMKDQSDVKEELVPGPQVQTDAQLRTHIKNEAWGHHASCSNKMGPASDPMAVVDSNFRVHGLQGLRVVDASIFPRIPGFFIVSAVYMVSEKATDAILRDARQG